MPSLLTQHYLLLTNFILPSHSIEPQSRTCSSKPLMRRRSRTRKTGQGGVINMDEARREVAHALHLHRSTPTSPLPSSGVGNPSYYSYAKSCCYSLVEAMPPPEPIWSTTAPSLPATPPPDLETVQILEWGENQAASYAWWLGFLRALDGNNNIMSKTKDPPFVDNAVSLKDHSPLLLGQYEAGEWGLTDQNACLDEWLMFPPTQDSL
ncbi:hypothetical protein ES319_A01G245600v1 [Gossypium barbadense]|uniref:Uncharacterized protein n=2 Tax=Gossypium TaxID=3633 RepID=A0A5J5X3S3_GOSBA|nr:hypothetical protein ES319_A01G245600v1 [Gossypium barbadense]TYI44911.1 hypothetical protein ES332_A01G270900v1 [Gossypium tomentosum]